MSDELIKVAIADDETLLRLGLKMLLENQGDIEVVYSAADGQEMLQYLMGPEDHPDLVLLDLSMPVMDGPDCLMTITQWEKHPKVIVLSSHYNSGIIRKMVSLGASAFINKNEKPDVIANAIRSVVNKGYFFDEYVYRLISKNGLGSKPVDEVDELSAREKEILLLICEEFTNKEIGEKLHLSSRTVEGHRQNLLIKTGAKNTAGLIIYAIEHAYFEVHIIRYQ